jgi:hypothetical protein
MIAHMDTFESGKVMMTQAKPMFLRARTKKEAESAMQLFRDGIDLAHKAFHQATCPSFAELYNTAIAKELSYFGNMKFLLENGKVLH